MTRTNSFPASGTFAAAIAATAILLTGGLASAAGPPGPPGQLVRIGTVVFSPASPFVGDNVSISVTLENNGSADLLLATVAASLVESDGLPGPGRITKLTPIAQLTDVPLPAKHTSTAVLHWIAVNGQQTIQITAAVRQGNATIPLAPVTASLSVSKPPIDEPVLVGGYLLAVILAIVLIVTVPAVIEAARPDGRRPSKPIAQVTGPRSGASAAAGNRDRRPPPEVPATDGPADASK